MKFITFFITAILIVMAANLSAVTLERPYYFYHASSDRYVELIDSLISDTRSRLMGIIRDSLSYKPDIYIEDDIQTFNTRIGGIFPDWGAAAAIPYKKMIVLKSPAHFRMGKSLNELVRHEYSHLALSDRLFNARGPRWLDEGVAMYVAAEWGWNQNFTLSKAVVFNSLVSLDQFEKMNRFSEGKAQVAYAESYMAVKYFIDHYQFDLFNLFLDQLKDRKSVDEALEASIQGNLEEFEKELFNDIKTRYNYMSLFGDLYFLWIFLAAVVVAGYLLSFIKKKRYYKKWEEEEKYQSTDFDYGDPDNPEQIDDEDEPWR